MAEQCVPLVLDRELFKRLERQASAHDRTVVGQARFILRQALTDPRSATEAPRVTKAR